ncbi:hypothetical protein HAX54_023568 [Datura stramonium]|uniref:Uncharacterized protein n=1 Tax=Datura stramonium TaxID=4076 RepID=A0ABS8UYI3_DATST|nr:hypothetical protein [Datura stramonium]
MISNPRKIFLPINLIITKIKTIFFNQPKTMLCRAAPLNIPNSMKSLKSPPFLVQFHCTQVHGVLPKFHLDTPTKIIAFLEGPPPNVTGVTTGRAPHDQRQGRVVGEPIDNVDVVDVVAKIIVVVVMWLLLF